MNAETDDLIDRIAQAIDTLAQQRRPPIPLSVDLWDIQMISQYLKRRPQVVRERIACLPDFPKPIRLPSEKGRAQPLYRATEVIDWTESHRDNLPGRPRKHD